ATSTFHCARLSDRYQGKETMAALVFMPITSLFRLRPRLSMQRGLFVFVEGEYTIAPRAHNTSMCD
ncbi:MAG TPA: hypothetical protein VE087_01805, partial [Xanthobacteraceae bacterium]|nr:hypothetical protein [Xanthobacteraceae bacterium]